MDQIRILIADDHPFFRDGLRVLLEATPDTEFVGEAIDGGEVVTLAAELLPDVILMDLRMQGLGGIEATRKILEKTPETGILVVTMVEDDDSVFAAMRAGARDEAVFGPGITRRLIRYFSSPPASTPVRTPRSVFPELTDREREILTLIAAGKNNQEIAGQLFLSFETVRNYVSNIFTKLQVADRAQAIIRARKAGLG